jgi:hypothetical protein
MELTGDMLIAFGEENGLTIMSHRDPDKWAEMINERGGICPCGKECPCDNCECKFYEKQATEDEMPEKSDEIIIKNDEIKGALEALEEAKVMLISIPTDDENEALDEIKKASEIIKTDANNHKCNKCKGAMEGISRKIDFLGGECKQDSLSCMLEKESTLKRIEQMQQIFIGIDKSLADDEIPDEQDKRDSQLDRMKENEEREQTEKRDRMMQGFHGCVSGKIEKGFNNEDMTRQEKFCTATKLCAKNSTISEKDAMESCIKGDKKQ